MEVVKLVETETDVLNVPAFDRVLIVHSAKGPMLGNLYMSENYTRATQASGIAYMVSLGGTTIHKLLFPHSYSYPSSMARSSRLAPVTDSIMPDTS